MEIVRLELLESLKRVAPALADDNRPLLPVLTHLCFDGKHVTAYDNAVAIRAPCKLSFNGALPGNLLLSMLNASAVDKVSYEVTESEVLLKMGRAKLKLASLPPDDFLFQRPDYDGATRLALDEDLMRAFTIVGRSVSATMDDSSKTGVTVVFGSKRLTLYATDNKTLVRCQPVVSTPELAGTSVIMSSRFHNLLLRVGAKELLFTEQGDMVALGDGIELFGRVIQGAVPDDYANLFKSSGLDELTKAVIPTTLSRCLERASLVDKEMVTLSYAQGRLGLYSSGPGGELRDSTKMDLGDQQIEVATCAECLLRYLDVAEKFGISQNSVVLRGNGFVVLVAVHKETDVQDNRKEIDGDD